MDDRMVAATLAAAVLAKTDIPPERDVAAFAVKTYQRLLRGVAKVNAAEHEVAATKPAAKPAADGAAPAKAVAGLKIWPPKKPSPA
ncbi:hypothetical protein [Labrys wisconsinensis]|uniref:Uncharacterized protein n=1 Tax=Labrys wisconsinensis TaxID=425677 RepID=A0ABU0JL33_9HYPH|nr:hypothetical protein [Labrys wisconsinensis]MDQ0474073.1 hypothetical protein [Labrys wisconsinensis]